jgi:hypothetical protein
MRYVLFYGRHAITTRAQERYLRDCIAAHPEEPTKVIFAVTSANHARSRYNPVAFHHRAIGLDRFAQAVLAPSHVPFALVAVPHMERSERFARQILTHVNAALRGIDVLTAQNTIVICSTLSLLGQFRAIGLQVHTAEYDEIRGERVEKQPFDLLLPVAKSATEAFVSDSAFSTLAHPTVVDLWRDYPQIPDEIERLYNDTILTESGDITETRAYGTYTVGMSRSDVIELKYQDIHTSIQPGVIVDEGCADGALLARVARDFSDSDLYGIEITREYIAEAEERVRRGEFGATFTHFYQRNLLEPVFEPQSIDTVICNSTTHELYSYAGGDDALRRYLALKHDQLKVGGVLLIRDVIGPEDGETEQHALFAADDGETPEPAMVGAVRVATLSTLGRWLRFSREFRGVGCAYSLEVREGKTYVVARRKDLADFLSKKDYVDNWDSELHESFTHWPFSRWCTELARAGFELDLSRSKAYQNPWIIKTHYQPKASLYLGGAGVLVADAYPPTNVVLVARRAQ